MMKQPPNGGFRPIPLLGNNHVQTVLAHFLPGPRFRYPVERRILHLADGDKLLCYDSVPTNWKAGDPIAVLIHGLTGSHASTPIARMATILLAKGVRAVRVDLRGAGAGLPLARKFYHAGRSEDVLAILEDVHRLSPLSPILLAGTSLGGNLVLKMAGENPNFAPLKCVAAISPPIDLALCADLLRLPRNQMYHTNFLRALTAAAYKRQKHFPELPPISFPKKLDVRLYDELYTAPRSGYKDADDYYRRCSAQSLIDRIKVPTLLLMAHDDPFIAVEPFYNLKPPVNVEVQIVPKGGHLGFLGWHKSGSIFWAENHVADWLLANADFSNGN